MVIWCVHQYFLTANLSGASFEGAGGTTPPSKKKKKRKKEEKRTKEGNYE